jgi:benzoyl-CoA reductase/2-hydroxyglutaryl-CoA dehydratase subunit BcrC/BadD/HgdB
MHQYTQEDCLETIDEFYLRELQFITEIKKRGVPVAAVFSHLFPLSILRGFQVNPIRIISGTTIVAENYGEQLVRPDACPFCKSVLGNFQIKSDLFSKIDLVIGLITCDQKRRMLERLGIEFNIPVFPINIPATRTDSSRQYYIENFHILIANIAEFVKKDLDPDLVKQDYNFRRLNAEYFLRLLIEASLPPKIMQSLIALHAISRPEKLFHFLNTFVNDIPVVQAKKKVLIIGSMLGKEDGLLLEILASHNVQPILLLSTGINAFDGWEDMTTISNVNLTRRLAEVSFNLPPEIRTRPNTEVYTRIRQFLNKTKADGIICKSLTFCDLWFTEKKHLQETFAGVPILILDTGYGEGARERVITRVETFVEMIG